MPIQPAATPREQDLVSVVAAFSAPPVAKRPCITCRILDALDPDGRALVVAALDDPDRWGHVAIAERLTGSGHPVSDHSIRTHRQRCA
ncbi:MAG: hypothetical protein ACOH10_15045 [Rhodoglobus sp.]